ncbi:TPA: hypothetical protein IAB95_05225, partial [Candidatus Ventrenecus avicola]|nr:hypothetical protein [Candidatus Ventrenecus avicola]
CTMKLEKFKEKDTKKRFIVIFTVCCILLLAGVFLYTSFAVFTEDKNFNVINGTYQDPGDIYFAYYVDGQITRNLPTQDSGYMLDEESSNCTNGVIPSWDYSKWRFIGDYSGYTTTDYSRTKCNLYFTKTKTVSTVLGDLDVYTYTPDFTKSACDDATCESHEKGIFETTDDDGTSYYYRGSVENNYVYFANCYWRIIRINGNGSIRMIYDGTVAHANGEASDDRQVGTSRFNPAQNDNMYLGYMYISGNVHGTGTSSVIKQANDNFYTSVLSSYVSYIDTNVGFCGDRSTLNGQSGVGTGTTSTYMKGYVRVATSTPSLTCENSSDLYTVSSSNKGNKALTYPVGLITADEVMLSGSSGGFFDGNYNYQKGALNSYLTTGNHFWTMTPVGYYNPFDITDWGARLFYMNTSGNIDDGSANGTLALRPVINIRSNVTVSGDGTISSPYEFS